MAKKVDVRPRGIRNNNPLNIVKSSQPWEGKLKKSSDDKFEQFVDIVSGIVAAIKIIRSYINRHKVDTPRTIIARWAPASDGNNVGEYVKSVQMYSKLNPDKPLLFADKDSIVALTHAMAYHETGRILPLEWFDTAYDKASKV